MKFPAAIAAAVLSFCLSGAGQAEEFVVVTKPSFPNIESRLVYGVLTYDFTFKGKDNNERSQSATDFLKTLIASKFNNKKGNYVVSLDISIGDTKITSEPILAATWETNKFLFITTSEKTNLVVNRNGVLVENLVVDHDTNKVGISMKIRFSDSTSLDMSLLKELADLSKTASLAAFAPGVVAVAGAYAPFSSILNQLLSKYTELSLVDNTVGAFTLLDEDFGNQLRYNAAKFSVNIYLKTVASQLPTNFTPSGFKITNANLVLTEVKSGVGAARAPVLDLIASSDPADLADFVKAIRASKPFGDSADRAQTSIRAKCAALKDKFNEFVTSRDAALLYWAFLKNFHSELIQYKDGKACADSDLREDLTNLGLTLSAEDWPQ